ncbi:hypothetical protein DLH98_03410 [Vibrio parahaemolyticus]|uniref:hypothetical protein n=1 Tax=Vibrio parahaemolyticus TaxID=670 RepID=UPI00040EED07|nr:hypothetical protein [Vibrio parahaemolyticus]KIT54480.1 hypothetical protein H334_21740 [Vibrio parahaemolyticus 901128]EGQ8259346.1 hypothetical protein [Vibrio parahaemolyticus]EGQ8795395.1 hypothetical protein [Vibrio parahaemolyticus]EGQ8838893.1 hypothetical protein [Vibrio parahaemolyticus]EGQ8923905.1 hypothetical protein [Vibrio parahaemolyticus]
MSQGFTIHPYIIDSLKKHNKNEFGISDIRDLLFTSTMQEKSKDYVRLFVSKELNKMVKQGILTTSGNNRNKRFHKTDLFELLDTSKEDILKNNEVSTKSETKFSTYLHELSKLRSKINAELTMLVAEMDEYQSIMAQFPQTKEKVSRLYEESTQYSATLTGQITAITKTIELLQSEDV